MYNIIITVGEGDGLERVRREMSWTGASIPIYRWRQMRHGQFWGN